MQSRPSPRSPLADPTVRRVCLVRLRVGLGDLLCSAPAVRALRRARPDVRVTVVTFAEMASVVERLDHVDDLLPFPGYDGIPERPPDPAGWQPFLEDARSRGFDLALQCYGDRPAANLVTGQLGARMAGGFAPTGWRPRRGDEDLHLRYPHDVHEVERHLRLLERVGLDRRPGDDRQEFPTSAGEQRRHAEHLAAWGLTPGRYAVLHPGASSPSRRWPLASYAAVAAGLHEQGLDVVATGTPDEAPLVDRLRRAAPVPVRDLSGRTDLAGLALLLRDAAVLVGNDTGTAHLAASVGGRAVTIFQPGDARRWGYTGPNSRALTPGVPCAPCPHLTCPIDFPCSRATTPADVLAAAAGVMGRGGGEVGTATTPAANGPREEGSP